MRTQLTAAALLGGLLSLSACGPEYDPLTREGLWAPIHANRANLVAQVANPADLVRGTGQSGGDGQLAAAAVDRLRTDKVKKLPNADIVNAVGGGANETGGSSGGSGTP